MPPLELRGGRAARLGLSGLTGLGAALGAGLVLGAAPAHADAGRCPAGTGVTVVVDPGALGGGTQVACAPDGAGATGSTVVTSAGFTLTFTAGQPFVCRVDGAPTAADENCQGTPPADAYWGLFWSDGDPATWTYSSVGISGLEVPEGGSIGWRWQDGGNRDLPAVAPTAQPAEPSDPPSNPPSDPPSGGGGGGGGSGGTGGGAEGGTSGTGGGATGGSSGGGSVTSGPADPSTPTPTPTSGPASEAPSGQGPGQASGGDARQRSGDGRRAGERRDLDGAATDRAPSAGVAAARGGSQRGEASDGDAALVSADGAKGDLEPLAEDGSGPAVGWLAAAVLLGLGAAATVLGRRRRSGP